MEPQMFEKYFKVEFKVDVNRFFKEILVKYFKHYEKLL